MKDKHSFVSHLYKIGLSISVLAMLGFTVWLGLRLFGHQLVATTGSILFLVCLAVFIFTAILLEKNKWRKPSFKLVLFSCIVVLLVLSFGGVYPLAQYKDKVIVSLRTINPPMNTTPPPPSPSLITPYTPKPTPADNELIQVPPKSAEPPQLTKEPDYYYMDLEHFIFYLINEQRIRNNVHNLVWSDYLYGLSKKHSDYMAMTGRFEHSDNGKWENIFWSRGFGANDEIARNAIRSWMESPPHKLNLLSSEFTIGAVGIAKIRDDTYITYMADH